MRRAGGRACINSISGLEAFLKGLLPNHGLDREFQGVQKGLLHGSLVNDLDWRLVEPLGQGDMVGRVL
jgi:hypothetical protein